MRTLSVWCVLVLVTATTWASKARTFLTRCSFEMPVEGCSCHVTRQNSAVISCTDLGLTDFPQFFLPDDMAVEYMDLSGNAFTEIPEEAFGHLIIKELIISRTTPADGIISFHPDVLSQQQEDNLVLLDISFNGLLRVPSFVGLSTYRLEELNLSGNPLQRLTRNDLLAMPNLLSLHLGTVIELTNTALEDVSHLEFISLCPSKKTTSAQQDLTHYFGNENLRHIKRVMGIHVRDSVYTITPSFLGNFEKLVYLEISNSRMRKSDIDFSFHDQRGNEIIHINFKNNNLKGLPNNLLRTVPALEYLDLRGNRIKSIKSTNFAYNQNLVSLLLGSNRIATINRGTFANMHDLQELDLSDNNLSILDSNIFPVGHFQHGLSLYAGGNPWYCDCRLLWLVDLAYKQHHGYPGPLDPYEVANSLECESPGLPELMYEIYDLLEGLCIHM